MNETYRGIDPEMTAMFKLERLHLGNFARTPLGVTLLNRRAFQF